MFLPEVKLGLTMGITPAICVRAMLAIRSNWSLIETKSDAAAPSGSSRAPKQLRLKEVSLLPGFALKFESPMLHVLFTGGFWRTLQLPWEYFLQPKNTCEKIKIEKPYISMVKHCGNQMICVKHYYQIACCYTNLNVTKKGSSSNRKKEFTCM